MRLACTLALASVVTLGVLRGASAADAFAASIDGRTYSGRLKAQVELSNGKRITRYGKATIQIEPGSDGSATMTVVGTIDGDANSASFKSTGRIEDGGWTSPEIAIGRDGVISGETVQGERRLRFSGTATDRRIRLETELVFLESSDSAYPPGTTFEFNYVTSRERLRDPADEDAADGGKCKSIRYEMRPTPNMFGGPIGMISVPVCIKE